MKTPYLDLSAISLPRKFCYASSRAIACVLTSFFWIVSMPALGSGGPLCDIDFTPPQITVTTPQRAAFIESASSTVSVTGMVNDTLNPIVSIIVNGQELLAGGGGLNEGFITDITAPWGMSIIEVSAIDACGNQSSASQAFIRSDTFYAAATAPDAGANITEGLISHFNQPAIDDGIRATFDDMATIAELIIQNIDYSSLLNASAPTTLVNGDTNTSGPCNSIFHFWTQLEYVVTRGTISIDTPDISQFQARPDNLRTVTQVNSVTVPFNVNLKQRTCTAGIVTVAPNINVGGSVTATDVTVTADIGISATAGELDVGVSAVTVDVSDVDVTLNCPAPFGGICSNVISAITNYVINSLLNQFGTTVSTSLETSVSVLLDAYSPDIAFELPPPIDSSVAIDLGVDAASVNGPEGTGFLDIGYGYQIIPGSRGASIPITAPGAARHDGASLPFSNEGYDLGFGIKDDVLNQLTWGIWYLGGLEQLDLATLITLTDAPVTSLQLEFGLPPILMPDGAPDRVRLGLGDVSVQAVVDLEEVLGPPFSGEATFEVFVSATLAGTLGFDQASQSLDFDVDTTTLVTQVTGSNALPAAAEFVEAAVEQAFALISTNLIEGLLGAVQLPVLELNTFSPGLFPNNETLGLVGVVLDRPVDVASRVTGFTMVDTDEDGDGVLDSGDNCTTVPNLNQRDTNGDGYGNACDPDLNNDGIVNFADVALWAPFFNTVNGGDEDFDGNGVANFIDYLLYSQYFLGPPGPSGLVP